VNERIHRFIVEEVLNQPNFALSEDDDLLSSGLIDSLAVMSLVNFIEEETGLDVPAEDVTLGNFVSIAAIVSYLSKLRQEA